MEIHEFVCADCEVKAFSFGGDPDAKVCQSCLTVREIVIKVHKTSEPGTIIIMHFPPEDEA